MTDIVYDTVVLPPAFVGVVYEAAIAFHGAASSITAASATGLPTGLSLVHSSYAVGASVRITGTPTAAATSSTTVVVTLTDSAGALASSDYTIAVFDAPNDRAFLIAEQTAQAVVDQLNM